MYNNEDRSWMYDRLDHNQNLTSHFEEGVSRFLEFAFSQTQLLNRGQAKCPCIRCCNSKNGKWENIQEHLYKWGFVPQYYVWFAHGEDDMSYEPPTTYFGESSSHHDNVGGRYREMVEDVFGGQFQHTNYNQVEHEENPPVKRFMRKLGLGYKTFDVCVNNCFLYYGEFESDSWTACPECGESRYEPSEIKKKFIARKKLWYLPLTPRLQRLYMSRNTAEHMTWHTKCRRDNDVMIHPASGEAWKSFDATYPDFAAESRNVRVGICTDGFNPYRNSSTPYSCWPVFVTPYNLHLICACDKNELKMLWDSGVQTYDSHRRENFLMRVAVMWTISDYPGYGMLSQWSTHGRLSCPYCMENTKSFQLKHGRKTSFFDCHRRFLPIDHPWRMNTNDFLKGRIETDAPLPRRLGCEMKRHIELLQDIDFGTSRDHIEGFGKEHNWCHKSIFWELPYWEKNLLRHNLDVMHCEKNFFDNIKNTVMDDPDKTKDNMNARRDLQLLTNRRTLFLQTGRDGKLYKRKAVYCLSKEQNIKVLEWLRGLRFPDGYASNISRCVQMQHLRLAGMRSHDCHVFMQRLMPNAFHDFLPDSVWGPLVEVSNFFRALCATELRKSDMEVLQSTIVVTMCKLEKIFPPSFFDSMEHLAIHLPWEAKVGGPVQYRWMYPFERRMFELKRDAGNKARVEASICEAYVMGEIANFSSHYFEYGIETRANRLNRNEVEMDQNNNESTISIFQKRGKALGRGRTKHLTLAEHQAAERYILLNYPEVDCWLRLFDEQMCMGVPENEIESRHNSYFVEWFKEAVYSGRYDVDPQIRGLAYGPPRSEGMKSKASLLDWRRAEGLWNGLVIHRRSHTPHRRSHTPPEPPYHLLHPRFLHVDARHSLALMLNVIPMMKTSRCALHQMTDAREPVLLNNEGMMMQQAE
uniref:Putative transposase n=1 Tax=Antirrhinum majus TaxID=4151 RepID=C0H5P0_ANTMA|nr:putative transposase [Antirrhinum majus]